MSRVRLGVLMPVYNRPTLALEGLASVAAQTRPADRVVVVDDASTDDSADRVAAFLEGRAGWTLIRLETNGGVSTARNRGLAELTDCDAVAFLDSDDLWPPEHLARMEQALVAAPDAVAAVAEARAARAGGVTSARCRPSSRSCRRARRSSSR